MDLLHPSGLGPDIVFWLLPVCALAQAVIVGRYYRWPHGGRAVVPAMVIPPMLAVGCVAIMLRLAANPALALWEVPEFAMKTLVLVFVLPFFVTIELFAVGVYWIYQVFHRVGGWRLQAISAWAFATGSLLMCAWSLAGDRFVIRTTASADWSPLSAYFWLVMWAVFGCLSLATICQRRSRSEGGVNGVPVRLPVVRRRTLHELPGQQPERRARIPWWKLLGYSGFLVAGVYPPNWPFPNNYGDGEKDPEVGSTEDPTEDSPTS